MGLKSNHRIGVISDTHDSWVPHVAELFRDVDEIWHLGDVCHEPILDELRAITPRLTVVLGNNDYALDFPVSLDLERNGERFHLVHILPKRPPPGANWLLFGHTHRPADEIEQGIHFFNPGSAGRGGKGAPLSVGFLTLGDEGRFRAEIVHL